MWGKHFASMYEGSMRGAGSAFFAVWGYVISHMKPNRTNGTTVELNPEIIAFLIGEKASVVVEQIKRMTEPDPKSRTKDKDGRKLEKLSEYTYLVINGDYYRKIRNEADRREYQRRKQAEYRKKNKPLKGEREYIEALNNGASPEYLDTLQTKSLPTQLQEAPPAYQTGTRI